MCPKKHPTDIKIEEIYLPSDYKSDLQRELKALKEKDKNIRKKIEKLKRTECLCCLNYIDGEKGRELIYFKDCNHIICSSCYKTCKLCPFCDLKSGQKKMLIKLEINDDVSEEDEYSDNEEQKKGDESSDNEEQKEEDEDNEVEDPLFKVNDSNLNEVNYDSDDYSEDNEDKKEESEKNKIENEDKNEKDDNDEMHLSSSYSNNDSREVYKRENQRDNNGERGRVRGRGERGRRVIRSRGNRGRARRYY